MTMSLDEIKDYLSDRNIPDNQLDDLAHDIQHHLDLTPLHSQIDKLLAQFAYWQDYDRTIRN